MRAARAAVREGVSRISSRQELPKFTDRDYVAAIDLALVLQHTGEGEQRQGAP